MNKGIKVLIWIVVIVAVMGLAVYGALSLTEKEEAKIAFQENMAIAAANTNPGSITGNKAITVVHKGETVEYTTEYIPEDYQTEDHTQIRYVINCHKGSELVGYYTHGGSGLKHKYTIEVLDLKLGTSQEKVFYGSEPPRTVSVKQGEYKSFYGSLPNKETIEKWVRAALTGIVPEDTNEIPESTEEQVKELTPEEQEIQEGMERAIQIATELLETGSGYSPSSLREWLVEYENCTEEEAAYAVEHCVADWKEQALLRAKYCLNMDSYGWGPTDLETSLRESYGFSAEAVTYAMANCDPDWREQALKCAKYYADGFGYSEINMYNTMIQNNGFSEEDARYGVDNCGADWYQAAVDHVAISLEYSNKTYTRESMIQEMMEWYGFTEEQAIYGVDQNGLN